MSEKCDRCGEEGEDRRTLWMECFYAMDELSVPFGKRLVFHLVEEKEDVDVDLIKEAVSLPLKDGGKINIAPPIIKVKDDVVPREMYTLRVCKSCRATWMSAIEAWFHATHMDPEHTCGSGIFIRENGAVKEITEEEWYKRNPGREPIRVRDEDEEAVIEAGPKPE